MADRITATAEALDALERLTVKHGALMLYQSGGCCDGSSPLCLQAGELLTGPGDVLLGVLAGAHHPLLTRRAAARDRTLSQPACKSACFGAWPAGARAPTGRSVRHQVPIPYLGP